MNRFPYRPDIDGLRAVAVLLVLVFHAFPAVLPGGFVGVDVFFVISGFLISRIIFSELEDGRFRLASFYDRRARRILPALLAVLGAALAFGLVALFADEYASLGKHVAAGAAFVSNFLLRRESGYFDAAAETKPLLHLWSLAIEEQFYLFWPLALLLVRRLRWSFLAFTVAVGALSFGVNLHLVSGRPAAAFYNPAARIWELMLGGVLAFLSLHRLGVLARHGTARALLGCALVTLGAVLIDGRASFPGWWALFPTVGAFLVLSGGGTAWPNRVLLSSRPLVWIGLISYPLYLWHWMLLVFARKLSVGTPTAGLRGALLLVSVGLASATYVLLEKPVRRARWRPTPVVLVVALLVVGATGLAVWRSQGLDGVGFRGGERGAFVRHFENALPAWRYFEREGILRAYRYDCNFYDIPRFRLGQSTTVPVAGIPPDCHQRDPRLARSVFLWGDSHVQQLRPGLEASLPPDWQLLQVASSRCPPQLESSRPEGHFCTVSNRFALAAIQAARPDVVIVGQARGHDPAGAERIAVRLRALGAGKVIFVGPVVQWTEDLPRLVARSFWPDTPRRTRTGVKPDVLQADAAFREAALHGQAYLYASPIAYFCDAAGCLVHAGDDRAAGLTTYDYGHLTLPASRAFARDVLVPLLLDEDGK